MSETFDVRKCDKPFDQGRALACESDRDGFWLVRWLRTQDIEAYVLHAASVAVSREHHRAKTDRLDTALLKRAFRRCVGGWTKT